MLQVWVLYQKRLLRGEKIAKKGGEIIIYIFCPFKKEELRGIFIFFKGRDWQG
jgi:hypothetical protein